MRFAFLAAVTGLSLVAMAAPASAQHPRSVEYFIMNNAARQQVEQTCYGGVGQWVHDAECVNAHRADAYLYAAQQQAKVKRTRLFTEDPQYYADHPLARMQALRECVTPSSALRYTAAACQAARIAAGG